jgi:hypothetical protein
MKQHAFPGKITHHEVMNDRSIDVFYQGMELRDYFAAKAMASMITPDFRGHMKEYAIEGNTYGSLVAKSSYEIADMMLAERDKK